MHPLVSQAQPRSTSLARAPINCWRYAPHLSTRDKVAYLMAAADGGADSLNSVFSQVALRLGTPIGGSGEEKSDDKGSPHAFLRFGDRDQFDKFVDCISLVNPYKCCSTKKEKTNGSNNWTYRAYYCFRNGYCNKKRVTVGELGVKTGKQLKHRWIKGGLKEGCVSRVLAKVTKEDGTVAVTWYYGHTRHDENADGQNRTDENAIPLHIREDMLQCLVSGGTWECILEKIKPLAAKVFEANPDYAKGARRLIFKRLGMGWNDVYHDRRYEKPKAREHTQPQTTVAYEDLSQFPTHANETLSVPDDIRLSQFALSVATPRIIPMTEVELKQHTTTDSVRLIFASRDEFVAFMDSISLVVGYRSCSVKRKNGMWCYKAFYCHKNSYCHKLSKSVVESSPQDSLGKYPRQGSLTEGCTSRLLVRVEDDESVSVSWHFTHATMCHYESPGQRYLSKVVEDKISQGIARGNSWPLIRDATQAVIFEILKGKVNYGIENLHQTLRKLGPRYKDLVKMFYEQQQQTAMDVHRADSNANFDSPAELAPSRQFENDQRLLPELQPLVKTSLDDVISGANPHSALEIAHEKQVRASEPMHFIHDFFFKMGIQAPLDPTNT